jgi:hypothetical protein
MHTCVRFALPVCILPAQFARATHRLSHLAFRQRHVQALIATTEAVLLSTYGGLADLERRLNNALTPLLAAQRVMLFAFQATQDMLLCTDSTKRSLQACSYAHFA